MGAVTVLLVDDEPLMRQGLRLILEGSPDVHIVGEAHSGAAALTSVASLSPDVVLMDIRMPQMSGIEAVRRLRREATATRPMPRVVMLTAFDTDEFILEALREGAAGFLLKSATPAEVIAAVREARPDDVRVSPAVMRRLVSLAGRPSRSEPLVALSPREREIATAVGRGASNAEIAAELYLSLPTVKTHLGAIFTKLGVANRVQLALAVHGIEPADGGLG